MDAEWEMWAEAESDALRAEERRPELGMAVLGALVTGLPLAVGVASGHRVIGLFCSLGALNVALGLPWGTRVGRRRWGTVALVGSAASVALATAVAPDLWLTVLVTVVWVGAWTLFRGLGAAAIGVAFVSSAVFVIVAGQPGAPGEIVSRTVAYLVGGGVTLVLAVAVIRPTGGRTPPGRVVDGRRLLALAREPGVVRSHALRAAVLVALATLGYRLLHVPEGYWIPLAVVAVLQPDSVASRTRAIQRALGTLVGVAAAGAVIAAAPSEGVLVACVFVTAGGLFALKARNYFWMVALLTPLVLLMLSAVHPEGLRLVAYRVADTFAGTALALVVVELWGRGGGAPAPESARGEG